MSSLRCLIELLESETQADMLRLLKDSVADIRKILHRAKSIRSYQGVDDNQSSFHSDNQSATYGLVPSYEAQLAQSPRYQRAEKAAADELLTRIARLVNELSSKDEKVVQLKEDTLLKDEIVIRLEDEILSKDEKSTWLQQDIEWMQEEAAQLKEDVMLKHDKMDILERDLSLKDKLLLSRNKRITELEGRSIQKAKLKGFEDDSVINWLVKNCNAIALRQHSREEANYSSQIIRRLSAIATSNERRPC